MHRYGRFGVTTYNHHHSAKGLFGSFSICGTARFQPAPLSFDEHMQRGVYASAGGLLIVIDD